MKTLKTKIFSSDDAVSLERDMNEFFETSFKSKAQINDIQFTVTEHSVGNNNRLHRECMVIYTIE